jgi:hypothetical protein
MFRQMFLLVNRVNGATVLLPAAEHTATLSGSLFAEPMVLTGADIFITRTLPDGKELGDTPTLRPGARYLPYLDYVFKDRVVPKAATSAAVIPPNLHARVTLAGGYLTEMPATDKAVADVMWKFIREDGEVTLTQALTDRLRYTLPLEKEITYALVIRIDGTDQVWPIPADGADIDLVNADYAKVGRMADDKGFHRLREYAVLYNLTSASTMVTLYPYPTAFTGAGLGGGAEPICGGGQTDDGEEPPPPPPGSHEA